MDHNTGQTTYLIRRGRLGALWNGSHRSWLQQAPTAFAVDATAVVAGKEVDAAGKKAAGDRTTEADVP